MQANDIQEDEELMSPRSEQSSLSEESLSNPPTSALFSAQIPPPLTIKNVAKSVRPNQKRKLNKADEVLEKVFQQLEYVREDKFDTIGKNLAYKIRGLPPDIAIVTEKLIKDIVFEAQMGSASKHTKITLQDTCTRTIQTYYIPSMSSLQSAQNNTTSTAEYYSNFTANLPSSSHYTQHYNV